MSDFLVVFHFFQNFLGVVDNFFLYFNENVIVFFFLIHFFEIFLRGGNLRYNPLKKYFTCDLLFFKKLRGMGQFWGGKWGSLSPVGKVYTIKKSRHLL